MDCYITWASERMIHSEGGFSLSNPQNLKLYRELKEIWKESFHDTEEYIELFLRNRFDPNRTIIAVFQNTVIGVLYLFQSEIIAVRGSTPILFGYALGVLKCYRGNGISKKIHDFLFRYCENNNCAYIFHAANEKLEAYYESIGIKKAGYMKKASFCYKKGKVTNIVLNNISPEEYTKYRNDNFMENGYLNWDLAAVRYAIKENVYCGGFCKKLICQAGEYLLLGKIVDDCLILIETTIPDHSLEAYLDEVTAYFGVRKASVFLPVTSIVEGKIMLQIMGYRTHILELGYWNMLLS
jgi:hypothetical protein